MYEEHDFQYAMENTRVVVRPRGLIETFGTTRFRFTLLSEPLDEVGVVRVRDGQIEAERPRIMSPRHFARLLLEGFGETARGYADWIEGNPDAMRILRYGFQLRKTDVAESLVHEPMEAMIDKLTERVTASGDPLSALIAGVDDAWEVCLLKFTFEMIQSSAGGNMAEWERRGLV